MAKVLVLPALMLAVVVAMLASVPTTDVAAPEWMRPAIADGREGIHAQMDTTRPGSPLVLTGARCRADGAFLLFYEHRWWWVIPFELAVEVPADWMEMSPRSFAGGLTEGLAIEYGDDLAGYFAEHRGIPCPDEPIDTAS